MNKKHIFYIISILLLFSYSAYSENIIAKYNRELKTGYKDSIKELGLYLFDKTNIPKGYIYAEPNRVLRIQSIPNSSIDPYKAKQNYLYDLKMENSLVSNPCKVAVLDSGINFSHKDLQGTGDLDVNGHGTCIAGIIGATKNNGIGISGITNNELVSIKIIGKNGTGRYFDLIKGIYKAVNNNIRLISIFSGGTKPSKALKEIIDHAINKNSIIIASGGNTNSKKTLYPAKYENVISVGALNNEGKRCNFNDWGFKNGRPLGSCFSKSVDFMLPGNNIYTTKKNGDYKYFKGTSASAAILTGIASYILGNEPNIPYDEFIIKLKNIIEFGPENITKNYFNNYSSSFLSSQIKTVLAPQTYNNSATTAPDDIILITRTLSKDNIIPAETSEITLTLTNNTGSVITNFLFTDIINKKLIVSDSTEVKIATYTKFLAKNDTFEVSVGGFPVLVNYYKKNKNSKYRKYNWSFTNFPPGETITIKYNVYTYTKDIYYFNQYLWTGTYNFEEYIYNEKNGDFLIVEMPDVSNSSYPYGKIVENNFNNITFSWANAGANYSYQFFVYKQIGSKLSLLYQNKFLTTNMFKWVDAGMLLKTGKTYLWKVRSAYNNERGKYQKLKFIPYNFDTPYIKEPNGIVINSGAPTFKWNKINSAGYYNIRLYQKKGGSFVKLSDYRTFNNIDSASWSSVAVDKNGDGISIISGKHYKWDIKAVDGTIETNFSNRSIAEFTYYNFDGSTVLSPNGTVADPTSKTFNFSWDPVTGATSYIFKVYKLIGNRKNIIINKTMTIAAGTAAASSEVTLSPLSNYEWQVIPKKYDIKGSKSIAYFSTIPGEPPEIISPIDVATSNKPVITWNSGYNIVKIRIREKTKTIAEKEIADGSTSWDLSATPEINLTYGKTYSFSLRAEFANGDLYTKWSYKNIAISRFEKPVVLSPITETDSLTPLFSWSAITGADKYKIILKRKTGTILIKDDITTNSYTYDPIDASGKELLDGNIYNFQVCGMSASGNEGIYSDLINFKVNRVGKPIITSPSGISLETTPLSWEAVTGADAYVWTLKQNNTIIAGPNRTTDLSYNYGDKPSERFEAGKNYTFEVKTEKTINGTLFYSLTSIRSFKVNKFPAPQSIYPGFTGSPIRYEKISTLTPLFQWTKVKDAYQYNIKIYDLKRRKFIKYNAFTENFQLTDNMKLYDNTKYYYIVRAKAYGAYSNWSKANYFRTALYSAPILKYPNRTIYTTTPTFLLSVDPKATKIKINVYKYNSKNKRNFYKTFIAYKNDDTTEITYYCPENLSAGKRYAWSAQTYILNIKQDVSTALNFEIDSNSTESIETTSDMSTGLTGLTADNITTDSISLSWTSIPSTVRYNIYLDNIKYTTTTTNSINLTGLSSNTKYIFSVSNEDLSGNHRKSKEIKVWTLAEPPTNIITKFVTNNSFKLKWDKMSYINKFIIYVNGSKYGETADNSYNITNLINDDTYSVQIMAVNPGNSSALSDPLINKTLLTAPDGLSYSNKTSTSFDVSWNSVTGSNLYHIYKDGIEYTTTIATSINISGLSADTTYLIEVSGESSSGEGERSGSLSVKTTAISELWTEKTTAASFSARESQSTIVYNSKMWVIGGTNSGTYKNDVYSSTDGINWNIITGSSGFNQRADHSSIVFDNKMWVIGGNFGATYFNDVWSSVDGNSWTEVTSDAAFSARSGQSCVVFDNKMWVIGGFDGTTYLNDVWYSTDGINWTQAASDPSFVGRMNHSCVVYNSKMWLIGGNDSVNYAKDVWYSTDGISWKQANSNASFGNRSSHLSFVFNNKMWVIAGQNSSSKLSDIWSSSDGTIWNKTNDSADFGERKELSGCVYNGNMWVIGGKKATELNDVWSTL